MAIQNNEPTTDSAGSSRAATETQVKKAEAEARRPEARHDSHLIGTTLSGRYRIEDEIGSGGMSTVYLAFDETLERKVAIKVLHREISQDEDTLERFRREARLVAQISHPHVVMVIDAGEDGSHPYIVLEHVRGETLKERIRRLGPLPVSEAVAYAIEIGRALEAAHERQLVHRDVKPQNVLIDEEGRAKVTDFGIARSLDLDARQLTAAGRVVGTTDYVSPEQALGHEVSRQSDVYSLGIVLYEMLTGEVPFKGESSVSVAMKHVREGLPDVQRRRPEVSAALAAVLERATAKDVEHRYDSTAEMVRNLEDVLTYEAARSGHTEGEATAVLEQLSPELAARTGQRHRRWGLLPVAVLVVAALAVAAVLVVGNLDGGGDSGTASRGDLTVIPLGERNALDYDPPPGGGQENRVAVPFLLDRDRSTAWETERYGTASFGNLKDGVGVYLDAGRPVVARAIRVVTPIKGWDAELYVANSIPDTVARWTKVGGGRMDRATKTLTLDTGAQRFRYFLVWITRLAPDPQGGGFRASVSELRLLG
jgi:tRNA A-37 threonylcarbamoyl transferase component Bud32